MKSPINFLTFNNFYQQSLLEYIISLTQFYIKFANLCLQRNRINIQFLLKKKGYLIEIHNFSCSFKEENNFLAKQYSNTNNLFFVMQSILVCLNKFASHQSIAIYSAIYFTIEVIYLLLKDYYLSNMINLIYLYLSVSSLQITFCFLILIFLRTTSDILLLIIVTIPLSIKLNQSLFLKFFNKDALNQSNPQKFLNIMRIILNQAQECQNHYLYKGQGIKYQNIIQMHELQCTSTDQSCFCFQFRSPDSQDRLQYEELSEKHYRKDYIEHLLLDTMEKYINSQKKNNNQDLSVLRLSLLTYLFEIINDPTRALINLFRIQFQLIQTNQIRGAYMFYFYQLKEKILKSYQEILFESNIENQRINMMGAILFDEKIAVCRERLRQLLIQSGIFYDFLCSDYIPLKQLEELSIPLINSNMEIESIYLQLFEINPFDIDLQYLASIYISVLDYQNRKISVFQKQALNNTSLSSKKLKKMKEEYKIQQKNYFTEKSCVIFSSFLENDYIINKVSNSFEQIFKIQSDTIIGKQLNTLVPKIIKNSHNKMIFKFIDQESLNIVKKGERQAFALDNKGFVFPITIRMKIDTFTNDIGVCALVQRINKQKSYILFQEDGKITDLSKKLFLDMYQILDSKIGNQVIILIQKLKYYFNEIEITQSIFNMIPSIESILKGGQFYTQFCSILVVKQDQVKKQNQQRELVSPTKTPSKKQYSLNNNIFLIQFKVGKITTKINVDILYVEIDFYEQEYHDSKKKRIINDLNYQYILKEKQQEITNNIFQVSEREKQLQYCISDKQATQISFQNQELNLSQKRQLTFNTNTNQDDETQVQSDSNIQTSPLRNERKSYLQKSTISNVNKLKNESITDLLYKYKSIQEEDRSDQKPNSASYIQFMTLNSSKYNQELSEQRGNFTDRQIETQKGESHYQSFRNSNGLLVNSTQNAENIRNHACDSTKLYSVNKNQCEQIKSNSEISKNNFDQIRLLEQEENLYSQQNIFSNNSLKKHEQNSHNYFLQSVKAKQFNQLNQIYDEEKSDSYEESNSKYKNSEIKRNDLNSASSIDVEYQANEKKNEIDSVNSSKFSSVELNKRSMIKKIQSQVYTREQQLMIGAGIISFLTLCIVTITMQQQNQNSLDSYLESFLKIDSAIYCFIDVLEIQSLSNYKDILASKHSNIINGQAEKIQEIEEIRNIQNKLVLNDYQNNLKLLVLHNVSPESIHQLQNLPFDVNSFTAVFYDDEGNPISIAHTTFSFNLQYTMMYYYYSIHQYVNKFADAEENFIWDNLINFKNKMKNLQSIVENYAQQQFQDMDNQQTSIFIVISVISAMLVLTIIPLSVFVQVQKEKIMKLSGSFQPTVLDHQIKMIELAIFKLDHIQLANETNKSMQLSMKSVTKSQRVGKNQNIKAMIEQALNGKDEKQTNQSDRFIQANYDLQRYIPRLQNKRNRSIATFSSLPKLRWNLLFVSGISISLLLIQPFLNIIQFKPFEKEAKVSLDERISIINIYSSLIENQAPHYSNIYMFNLLDVHPQKTYYYSYIQNITERNQNAISAIPQMTLSLDVKRFQQNRFKGFYEGILNGDLCEVKEKFPQYFNSNITKASCDTLFEGTLKRGLLLSFKKAFDTYFQLFELYSIESMSELINEWKRFQERNSLIEFNTLIKVVSQSVNAIRKFQNEQLQEYHNQITNEFFHLFMIQLLIVSIIFLIGWAYLFYFFDNQLKLTKKILTLFHINLLFENTFIQAYFKKTSIGRKI